MSRVIAPRRKSPIAYALPLVLLGGVLLLSMPGQAQEWTRFRGPNGSGLSSETTIPPQFTLSEVNWRVELPGAGHSSPVLWGKKIFLTSAETEQGKRHLLCLNAEDGRALWTKTFPFKPYHTHQFNTAASATPAVDASRVYVTWPAEESFLVVALDHNGKELWRRDLGPYASMHGGASSPIIFENVLVLTKEPETGGGGLYGLDTKTGAIRWQRERSSQNAAYSTPLIYRPKGGAPEVIFSSTLHGITSLNPLTGELNWEVKDLFRARCVGSPVLVGDNVFATAGEGGGSRQAAAVRPASKREGRAAEVAFRITRGASYVPTPLVMGDRLYCWGDGGIVTCFRAGSGEMLWSERVGGNFFGSPVGIQGRLYAMSDRGELVVIADSDTFQLLARTDLGESSRSTPAVSGGALYLRTESHLLSVGGRKSKAK